MGFSLMCIFYIYFRTTNSSHIVQPTAMRMNKEYQHYYIYWFRSLATGFVPFILLAVLNGKIIHKMKQNKQKQVMSNRVRIHF